MLSDALGVGRPREDEDPEPTVWGSGIGRSNTTPLRIEPQIGQVPEYCVDRSPNKSTLSVESRHRPLALSRYANSRPPPLVDIRRPSFLTSCRVAVNEPISHPDEVVDPGQFVSGGEQFVVPRLTISRQQTPNVLDEHQRWAQFPDRSSELCPQPRPGALPKAAAGARE